MNFHQLIRQDKNIKVEIYADMNSHQEFDKVCQKINNIKEDYYPMVLYKEMKQIINSHKHGTVIVRFNNHEFNVAPCHE